MNTSNISEIKIRPVTVNDAQKLLEIYAPYVENTAVTFEYTVPSVSEFENRILNTLRHYPYILACIDGHPVGYAYAGALNTRAAYAHSAELSVYVRTDCRGRKIGSLLYRRMEKELLLRGVTHLYACVAYAENTDCYLDNSSVMFHRDRGFEAVGHFTGCGIKFGRSYDVLWFQKIIGE